jgi:hypothetical protein
MTTRSETDDLPALAGPEDVLPKRRSPFSGLFDLVRTAQARVRATIVVIAGRSWRRLRAKQTPAIPEMSDADRQAALELLEADERLLDDERASVSGVSPSLIPVSGDRR